MASGLSTLVVVFVDFGELGVDNLFIVDGSVFVTGAAVNPTPTIQALALRTADYIANERQDLKA